MQIPHESMGAEVETNRRTAIFFHRRLHRAICVLFDRQAESSLTDLRAVARPTCLLLGALFVVACGTPNTRYSFPSKGGAQRGLPHAQVSTVDAGR